MQSRIAVTDEGSPVPGESNMQLNRQAPSVVRRQVLTELYPHHDVVAIEEAVDRRIAAVDVPRPPRVWDERTAWMIAYPGQVRSPGEAPLVTLRRAVAEFLECEARIGEEGRIATETRRAPRAAERPAADPA